MPKTYFPNIAIHPGKTLAESLSALKMSQIELANRTGLDKKTINEIINGKNSITPDTAIKLERVFGTPASFWNNLEKNYHENLAHIKAAKELEHEATLAKDFKCYSELVKNNFVTRTNNMKERASELLRFFGVNSLDNVAIVQAIAFRRSYNTNIDKKSLAAWLRCGDIEAMAAEVNEFNRAKLIAIIDELRALTTDSASDFCANLKAILKECGIKVVFIPFFKRTYVNGASRWIGNTPLIQLSHRNKRSDIFWFTLFHEIGHILKHGKKEQYINFDDRDDVNEEEVQADKYAMNTLIPPAEYKSLIENNNFSNEEICKFAEKIGISAGIVAGRLAREGRVEYTQVSGLWAKIDVAA